MAPPHTVVYRCLWAVRARSARQCELTGTWAAPLMTGAIEIERGGQYDPTIHHGDCSKKNTPSMVLPHTVVYRRLWAVRARSARRRVLIGTWATPPMTGAIEFDRGGEYYPTIHHGDCSEKKSPLIVLPHTVVYRRCSDSRSSH
jgi:hypothetical protein